MKKIMIFAFALLFAVLQLVTVSTAVEAEDYDFSLKVEGNISSYKPGDTFLISATVVDIKNDGVAVVEYTIHYDESVLELVDAETVLPDVWKPYVEKEYVEDLSQFMPAEKGGGYRWSVASVLPGIPLRVSNQLSLKLTFKVLKEKDTEISFVPGFNANDDLQKLTSNNVAIRIKTESNVTAEDSKQAVEDKSESVSTVSAVSGSSNVAEESTSVKIEISGNYGDVNELVISGNQESGVWKTVLIVVGLIALFALVFCLVFYFMRKKNK